MSYRINPPGTYVCTSIEPRNQRVANRFFAAWQAGRHDKRDDGDDTREEAAVQYCPVLYSYIQANVLSHIPLV